MYKIVFDIIHKDCWATALSKEFPEYKILLSNFYLRSPESVVDYFYIEGDRTAFPAILAHIRASEYTSDIKIVDEGEDYLFLQITTTRKLVMPAQIFKNDCVVLEATKMTGGHEFWTIGSAARKNLLDLYEDFKNMGKVKILFLKKISPFRSTLTKKQEIALRIAYENNYYRMPRNVTLAQLAAKMKVTKTAYLEHLRRAESKIISEFIGH